MSHLAYHQASDGSHVINILAEFGTPEVQELIDVLGEIAHASHDRPAYVLINMRGHYVLPLRDFSSQLKRFYQSLPEMQMLFVAMLVDTAVVSVLSTIVKTLVKRDSIQYFTQEEKAQLWLSIERGKQKKKLA